MKTKWVAAVACTVLSTVAASPIRAQLKTLGEVDFFGNKGIDVTAVRAALPFHEGDLFPPAGAKSDQLKREVNDRVKQITGRAATDVSFVCCDSKQHWMVYVGVQGESYRELHFNPVPMGTVRLPKDAVTLGVRTEEASQKAVMSGHAEEDDSTGYALTRDPETRSAQLAMRNYALRNETLIMDVLASSSDARHRAIAAKMLGYARQSDEQVDALVRACLDSDDDVRNNGIRALAVLAGAKPDLTERIPVDVFVRLIRSAAWTDHNKASFVLVALTKRREPRVLSLLRSDALDPLIEMARWRSDSHAYWAVIVLGRIAGLDDDVIGKMMMAGEKEKIIDRVVQR